MKRLFSVVLFSWIVAVYITSVANEKDNTTYSCLNFERNLITDTIIRNQFLKVDPFRLNIVSPSSGVQFYKNGIVFLSHSKAELKMLPSHVSFGTTEAFYAILIDSVLGDHMVFSPLTPFTFPCEAFTFDNDYTTMYFTKRPKKNDAEKIYQAEYSSENANKSGWVIYNNPLDFCNDNSTYTHPSLSANGEIMVFASNRKGTVGGLDLFITRKEGMNWSSPENLGELLNTTGNELFPFIDSENNLYFSSDGHKGFGGYDVFISRFNGKDWNKPANLTQFINTENDELAFTLNRNDGKSAFFTTRQKSGKKLLQLYRVTFKNQYALNELTNLSNAFAHIALLEKPSQEEIVAEQVVPAQINPPQSELLAEIAKKKAVKEEIRNVKKPVEPPVLPEKKIGTQPLQQVKDVVVFRVQFVSNGKPKGSYEITIGGKVYKTYEYFYNGLYRVCVGDFSTLAPATNLQNSVRKEGYPKAFVVAFKNNERSLDLTLFK